MRPYSLNSIPPNTLSPQARNPSIPEWVSVEEGGLLLGSWVVISRVLSRIAAAAQIKAPVSPPVATHEPPSMRDQDVSSALPTELLGFIRDIKRLG